ncbi:hypothetical protein EKO04_010218 [Ascochyta lentis]|uniref:Uncharacterized protein n=1 Tax=Ascochyta lentis TaxID=205686 RepID=A0A8H7IYA5_9PLEO|nr:hypothetical protein EKO04_010218 [Ascochyta lentis]
MSNTKEFHEHNSGSNMAPKRKSEALMDSDKVTEQLEVLRRLYVAEEENKSMQEEITVLDKEIADLLEDSKTEETFDVYLKFIKGIRSQKAILDEFSRVCEIIRATMEDRIKNSVENPEFIKIDKQAAALYDEFKHTKYWDEHMGGVVPRNSKRHVEE